MGDVVETARMFVERAKRGDFEGQNPSLVGAAWILANAILEDPQVAAQEQWKPIASAPKDENVIIATTKGWVGEARLDHHPHNDNWVWVWANSSEPIAPELVPLKWQHLPAHPSPTSDAQENAK